MMVEPVDDPVVSVKRHLVAEQATEPGPGRKLAGLAAETLELMWNKKEDKSSFWPKKINGSVDDKVNGCAADKWLNGRAKDEAITLVLVGQ